MGRYELYAPRYPLLPLKNVVIFPRNVVTLLIGRARSIQAVEEALLRDRRLVVTAHRDSESDDPGPDDLHRVGTLASIVTLERQHGGNIQVVLEGFERVRIDHFDHSRPFFTVGAEELTEPPFEDEHTLGLIRHVQDLAPTYTETRSSLSAEVLNMVERSSDPGHLADLLATQLISDLTARQELLELIDGVKRLEKVAVHMTGELEMASLEQKIKAKVRDQIDKNQREYFLREQLKAIHDELGGQNGNEIETLRTRVQERGMPEEVTEKLLKEIGRLERMPPVSAEATVVRGYLDTMLALPWHERTEDQIDLDEAERILDEDHYGLEHVKDRILDYLAVRKLTSDLGREQSSQILCLIGPPGVGKTSLGRSVARAMGRSFVRVSLGGVRDEAEIRGHRRTYIGALPGRIIGGMKQAKTINPVILLDELDKLASDYRGDPTAAMLEVLDPEQHHTFTDHYLDVPYDLSKALFIATANHGQPIPGPLKDRMEIIEVSGYTEDEKIAIAQRYLLPRQLTRSGLSEGTLQIDHKMWTRLVREYTREAGVRGLDREVAALCRKVARDVVRGKTTTADGAVILDQERLEAYLGPKKFGFSQELGESQVGLATGLGVTGVGGEILSVEVATMPGKGGLTITGKAGDVMQESARAALSYARSRAKELHIEEDFQERYDLHIHLPEGATPKDGPSAGITMATALISALTRRPVRNDTAMTGEITLRGRVLPIGGLKDKTLAAHRHGIRRVIAPQENERELVKIPANIRNEVEFIFVSTMDQVIAAAIMLDETQVEKLEKVVDLPLPVPDDAHLPGAARDQEAYPEVITDASAKP
jgi:ATP-dependent Lon protease